MDQDEKGMGAGFPHQGELRARELEPEVLAHLEAKQKEAASASKARRATNVVQEGLDEPVSGEMPTRDME